MSSDETAFDKQMHIPEVRSGCYYARPTDCCWLCYLRIVGASLRHLVTARE